MPLQVYLQFVGDKKPTAESLIIPEKCAFIEDYGTDPIQTIGVYCNEADDGFAVISFDPESLEEVDGESRVDLNETNLLYRGAEDETYRHPYIDKGGEEAIIISRHIGGAATQYILHSN